jgi:hypothetical protein
MGCDKNDLSFKGNLNISFYNHPSDLKVLIYSMDNKEIPIYEASPRENGLLTLPLNIGNYIIKPYTNSKYYQELGFQIMQNKSTSITYNEINEGILNE